jgi:hypothetical protein
MHAGDDLMQKSILEGDLARVQVPDLFTFLAMIRVTGKLVVRQAQMERTIHWKEGEVVFATSNSPEHTLGQFLLRNGKITQEQYDESTKRVGPAMRHGKVLVQMGAISPNDLWWGVKNQTLDIIYSLFTWTGGSFTFAETGGEETVNERIVLQVTASNLVMEGIRRLDETARIREKILSLDMVFEKVPGAIPDFESLEMSENEIATYNNIDGARTIRELIGKSELTEFEVTRILFQLLMARLIEQAPEEEVSRAVFLDVEDEPELLRIVTTYNNMFAMLYESLADAAGVEGARGLFMEALESTASGELWTGVSFDQDGRFDENMLIGNISELPFERRKGALEDGLNTLLSVQLFEVSQHLDAAGQSDVFQFISAQKALLETTA